MSEPEVQQEEPQYTPEELRTATAGVKFMRDTPDYYPCEQNAERIDQYLEQRNWLPTVEHLSEAYQVLNEAGLLVQRPKSRVQAKREEQAAQELSALEEHQRQAFEAEQAELQRRRDLGSTAEGLKELKRITDAEVAQRRKSGPITHTSYPVGKSGIKSKLI